MLSPLQSAAFIESKIVSIVSSACFWVSWRLATRMAIRSLFSIACTPRSCGGRKMSGRKKRYPRLPGTSKGREADASGGLLRPLGDGELEAFRLGSRLHARVGAAQERFQRFTQGRLRRPLCPRARLRQPEREPVRLLRRDTDR